MKTEALGLAETSLPEERVGTRPHNNRVCVYLLIMCGHVCKNITRVTKGCPKKDPEDEIQGSVGTEAPVPPRVVLTAPGVHTLRSGDPGCVHGSTVDLLQTFFCFLVYLLSCV